MPLCGLDELCLSEALQCNVHDTNVKTLQFSSRLSLRPPMRCQLGPDASWQLEEKNLWLHVFSPGALGLLQLAGNSDVGGPWVLLPEILQDTKLYLI